MKFTKIIQQQKSIRESLYAIASKPKKIKGMDSRKKKYKIFREHKIIIWPKAKWQQKQYQLKKKKRKKNILISFHLILFHFVYNSFQFYLNVLGSQVWLRKLTAFYSYCHTGNAAKFKIQIRYKNLSPYRSLFA